MADRFKVLIVELNNSELLEQEEYDITADTIYFNKAGFTAADIGAAIVEATTKSGKSRYVTSLHYAANAIAGRELESISNVSSFNNPLVVPEASELVAWTLVSRNNSTGTITVYKNGSSWFTASLSAADRTYQVLGSPLSLAAGDELSAEVTSGSIDRPLLQMHIKPLY